jgi:hypothetical protein
LCVVDEKVRKKERKSALRFPTFAWHASAGFELWAERDVAYFMDERGEATGKILSLSCSLSFISIYSTTMSDNENNEINE